MKTKILTVAAAAAVLVLFAVSCSSGDGGEDSRVPATAIPATAVTSSADVTVPAEASFVPAVPVSASIAFTAGNGAGTVMVSGEGSPVVEWLASQPGETSLDLPDADIGDAVSVVEEVISFWFFRDENSGDTPPLSYQSDDGAMSDSLGTSYTVASEPFPLAPGTETTTATTSTTATSAATTASTTSAVSSVPETTETPTSASSTSASSTTTTTTAEASTATTTSTNSAAPEPSAILQVRVLNGSGAAGAAGRLTEKLSRAGYEVLPAGNAPGRYRSSAVYYAEGWQADAEEILAAAEIDEIEQTSAMPEQFRSEQATVIVLLGTDTAPAVAAEQASLRPRQRNDVILPLSDDIPRDRYVPGLSAVNLYTEQSENDPASAGQLVDLALFMGRVGYCHPYFGGWPQGCQQDISLEDAYQAIEDVLGQLGFTPQNVCGAPAGYSFTDLLEPTREWNEDLKNYSGDAIFTTDRLIELHGGERINPEDDLEFYIQQAVQTAHDMLRIPELAAETESMQLILCAAFLAPSGELPELASSLWYANLTPGIQPRESLLSQGTYHMKQISRNGNRAFVYVCHPTLGGQGIALDWREAGYRAEVVNPRNYDGCQATFEQYDNSGTPFQEETITFSFGERVFSASDMQEFPRPRN